MPFLLEPLLIIERRDRRLLSNVPKNYNGKMT